MGRRRVHSCGTNAGYGYHTLHGTLPCAACREARRVYEYERRNFDKKWRGLGLSIVKCAPGLGWPMGTRRG